NRPEGSVYIMASVDDLRCRLYIADTGPGIAAHQVETIFKPFERLEHGKGEIEGSGIGLTIAKQLMELMNGSIGVTSNPGEGSTFSFELDVTQEQPTGKHNVVEMPHIEQAPPPEREASSASGEDDDTNIVLYVEDNMINRTLMEHIFRDRPDIRLIMAETAAEGIRLARIVMPLLIMMDIRLPDASGYDALANLQTNERTAHIPVVAVSANVTENDIQRGREAGFIDYLEKPVEIDRLMRLIDLYLTPSEVLPN
ncbi:MAG: ATP-binding protein, partial [Sedimenticola sp.]